jgi:endonuclease-3
MKSGKIVKIIKALQKEFGEQKSWNRKDVFRILIGTVLSARTRDEQTAKAAERLFSRFKSPEELAAADIKEIEKLIRPSGFYRQKAKRIKEISNIVMERYDGSVPDDIDKLLKLPGVGRKTAGIVMIYGFGKPVAIPVDTHLRRIPNRMGLVKTRTPEQTEKELMKLVPKRYWIPVNHLFVKFGQTICRPVKPLCFKCPVEGHCEFKHKNL